MSNILNRGVFSSLPDDIIIDNLLITLPVDALCAFSATLRDFYVLCNLEVVWRRKLRQDFGHARVTESRSSGYKLLYRAMMHPKVYVWGSVGNGRLGLSKKELQLHGHWRNNGVLHPVELKFFSKNLIRIAQLASGEYSFTARDSRGTLWVWGQLDAQGSGFQVNRRLEGVHKLVLPVKVQDITSGRNHSTALDSNSDVWTFRSWMRPFRLVSPLLKNVKQVACGFEFSAALTEAGEVYVWWPGHGAIRRLSEEHDAKQGSNCPSEDYDKFDEDIGSRRWVWTDCPTQHGRELVSAPWDMYTDPLELPGLGSLRDPRRAAANTPLRIVQIACGQDYVVALTNANQVLKIDVKGGAAEDGFARLREAFLNGRRWNYLPLFTEAHRIAGLPAFAQDSAPLPADVKITHVSAAFNTFFAYSSEPTSIVLMGNKDTKSDTLPTIIPGLQHRGITSVAVGDYHSAAWTSGGELLTWGAFSNGALGHGKPDKLERWRRPPDLTEPTPVTFLRTDTRSTSTFCLSGAAAGWHTGALVMHMDEELSVEPLTMHIT